MTTPLQKGMLAAFVSLPTILLMGAATDPLQTEAKQYFQPLPAVPKAANPHRVELGRQLFFEPRLSANGTISCNSCHNLASYGVDNLATSLGHRAQLGGRNSPTVLNAGLHAVQFWDGRAKDLKEQAKGPILNPVEMAMPSEAAAVNQIKSIPGYAPAFQKAFPGTKDPITYDNIADAIASFEKTLVTPARFDRFLQGDAKALTAEERKGLKLFMDKGCIACHSGPALGGGSMMKFGLVKPYKHAKDLGRFDVTKQDEDKFVFKVPSLRNITRTQPYFHDGQVWSLDEAITIMGETQLGVTLSKAETQAIKAFFGSLEGQIPATALQLPVLPASGPLTARPTF